MKKSSEVTPEMIEERVNDWLGKVDASEREKSLALLNGFCTVAKPIIMAILDQAREAGKWNHAISVIEKYYETYFYYQPNKLRGQLDLGKNLNYYNRIYGELGIPAPAG